MFFNRYFVSMFSLVSVIAILHSTALVKFFYWDFWWFDILMHLLGGLWIAILFFWLRGWLNLSIKANLLNTIFAVLLIGFLWEAWELSFGLTFVGKGGYMTDTIIDLIMDLIGGVMAITVFRVNQNERI